MSITQTFYDNLAPQYDKLFSDWQAETGEQAVILNKIFQDNGYDKRARILDCACGIGTQAIGLASLGYNVVGSDISEGQLTQARQRALRNNIELRFEKADFCSLSGTFSEKFDIVICMDNALPHMLSKNDMEEAIISIANQITAGGMFVASIRDYDALLMDKPPYSLPYVYKSDKGRRVSLQTWEWQDECYKLIQYIIDDEETLNISKFECQYRAVRREELTELLKAHGCNEVLWKYPEETGFYQPIVVAKK